MRIGDGGGGIGEDASGTGEGRRGIVRGDEEDVGDDDVYDDARERVGAIATGVHGAKVFKFTRAAELRARGGWDGAGSRRRQRRDGTVVDDGDGESARATRAWNTEQVQEGKAHRALLDPSMYALGCRFRANAMENVAVKAVGELGSVRGVTRAAQRRLGAVRGRERGRSRRRRRN